MKHLLLIIFLSSPQSLLATDKKSIVGEIKQQKEVPGAQGALEKLLTIQGVDTQYQLCSSKVGFSDIPNCLWNGLDNGEIKPLPDNLRKKVQQVYADEQRKENNGNNRSPANSGNTNNDLLLTKKSKQLNEDYMSDPAVVKLSEHMQKKLEEALIGDEQQQKDKKTVAIVDHSKFIELYKTELGKTIVSSFTSYCMEVNFDAIDITNGKSDCSDNKGNKVECPVYLMGRESTKRQTVERNISSLKTADLSNQNGNVWTACIGAVSRVCYDPISVPTDHEDKVDLKRSKTHACIIMDYVKSARKNLMASDELSKFYQRELNSPYALGVRNQRQIKIDENNNIDAVTTVTSKDIEKSYEAENKKLQAEMNQCLDKENKIIDAERCKKFLNTDAEANKKNLAEFSLRQFALEETLKEKLQSDDEVKKYLKEEGYSDDKIQQMTSDKKTLDELKLEIQKRYANERAAIIDNMTQRLGEQTSTRDNQIVSEDQEKLTRIRDDFSNRSEDLKQLVHFNNIVSSFLEIKNGGKTSRNVASFYQELNNGAKNIRGVDQDSTKAIQDNAKKAGLKEDKSPEDKAVTLDVNQINEILKYSNEK